MKLVDILARELKVWPEGAFYITQDYDLDINQVMRDCTPVTNPETGLVWHANPGMLEISVFETVEQADDFATAIVSRAEWQAAVDALNAPKSEVLEVDWSRAPEDATHAGMFNGKFSCWYMFGGDLVWRYKSSICGTWQRVAENRPASILTGRPIKPEWSEDGLPNVGTKCVVYKGSYNLLGGQEDFIGPVVTVTARFKSDRGIEMACVDSGTDLGCQLFRADMCFHLPTAEEIARREREDAIEEMVAASPLVPLLDNGWVRKNCAALYDADYRKQVTK